MEDPIFDPWGTYEGSETPGPPSSGADRRPPLARPRRWGPLGTHARAAKSRRPPRPLRIERGEPVEATMRDVVRSHLEALARRLEVSRHEASITDGAQEENSRSCPQTEGSVPGRGSAQPSTWPTPNERSRQRTRSGTSAPSCSTSSPSFCAEPGRSVTTARPRRDARGQSGLILWRTGAYLLVAAERTRSRSRRVRA
jgi:hypothetical protein